MGKIKKQILFADYFKISQLSNSVQKDDYAWKNALLQVPEKEIDGTCIGYGTNSISGRRMDAKFKQSASK